MNYTVSTMVWRRLLLSICAFVFALVAIAIGQMTLTDGAAGIFVGTSRVIPFHPTIFVRRNSPGWTSGLRTSDVLDIKDMTPGDRFRLLSDDRAGTHLHLKVVRANHAQPLTVTVARAPFTWDLWLAAAGCFWTILFATLLAWRRPDSPEARTLALLLLAMIIGVLHNWRTPWPFFDALVGGISQVLFAGGLTLLATYAMLFAHPPSRLRRMLMWASYAGGALVALYTLFVNVVLPWTAIIDPTLPALSAPSMQIGADLLSYLLPLLCVVATMAQSRGAERARFLWASVPLCTFYAGYGVLNAASVVDHSWYFYAFGNLTLFTAPLGLTYSLLNRRLMDVGFVVNRAAIFSGVSIVIVGLFVLTEWALSEWMRTASHETNIAVSAALALLLGLSIRFVHTKVEHVVDYVMFRKRREDEEAIRKMAREAPYITDHATLLERVRQTLEGHTGASFARVLLDDGRGRFGAITENDPALVTLRAEHARLDLHETQTAIEGEWAYPMVARGRLVGALVLGPKQSQESYAPDESAAIAQLAHSVAGALDLLNASQNDTMLHELRDLRMVVSTMAARLDGVVILLDGTRA